MFRNKFEHVQWTTTIFYISDLLGSRHPIKLPGLKNLTLPFESRVWFGLLASLMATSLAFWAIHRAYRTLEDMDNSFEGGELARPVVSSFDFFLYTLSTLTEPLEICWFERLCAGKDFFKRPL